MITQAKNVRGPDTQTLGQRIYQLRVSRKWTLDEVASCINQQNVQLRANKSMVSRWENDQSQPSVDYAVALAWAFGMTLEELINRGE